MRLRKYLRCCHDAGRGDALAGRMPSMAANPGPVVAESGALLPYGRWAYDAGYADGRQELVRLARALKLVDAEQVGP